MAIENAKRKESETETKRKTTTATSNTKQSIKIEECIEFGRRALSSV